MFYVDGITLSKIKDELKNDLVNKKINKITKNTDITVSLHFGKMELLFSTNPSFPICYINNTKEENMSYNTSLVTTLRKHLINAMLIDIEQLGYDRILVFKFSKVNELGELKIYKIYFEIMGKYSNFIVTDENDIIIDVLKRFSLEENRLRGIFPGLPYEQPIVDEKISPNLVTEEKFNEFLKENAVVQNIEGIGKLLASKIDSYEKLKEFMVSPIKPRLFLKNNNIILATLLDIEPKKDYTKVMDFESFRDLINYYIEQNNLSNTFNALKNKLLASVTRRIKKDEKILASLAREKEEKKDFEKYKEIGDILASQMYQIKKGMDKLETYDFYNNKEIIIPLDPEKSANQNLENYYKKYNKLKRGIENNTRRNIEISEELEYLQGILVFIENSDDIENLKIIYDELVIGKYMQAEKNKKNKKKKPKALNFGMIEYPDCTIYYGRNNIENDNLTFKVADKNDIWLHSKNIPGSHVIIKCDEISDDILLRGARVAAFYSKAIVGDVVSVDYTLKKYMNKPRGSKPGFVTYTHEKNINIEKPNKL